MKSSLLLKVKNSPWYLLSLAVLSGLLFWMAWPVRPLTFLLFLFFVPLLAIEDHIAKGDYRKPKTKLFAYTYLTAFLWNVTTTWWIYNVAQIAVIPAVLFNTLFMTLPVMGLRYTRRLTGDFVGYVSFVLYWLSFEYIHLNWDLSWPWLTLGNGFAMTPNWVQWYEYTGVFGGTIWILGINILFFILLFKGDAIFKGQIRWVSLVYTLLLIALPIGISYYIYHNYEESGEEVEIVVMQPNIDPFTEKFINSEKFIPFSKQLQRFINLSEQKITPQTDFVVWPETALDKVFNEANLKDSHLLKRIGNFKAKYPDLSLVTGMTSYKQYASEEEAPATARYRKDLGYYDVFNSALFVGDNNKWETYHKMKLVPGAEILPYPGVFGFLADLMLDLGGTSGGFGRNEEPYVFTDEEEYTVAPSICYESIYGEHMSEFVRKGAEMIFIITNDGWWGNTAGHKQHLNYAVLRAIESRRSIARSANTGISAFINQKGEIIQPTVFWTQDVIRAKIRANEEMTFYSIHGDYLARNALWLAILILLSVMVKNNLLKKENARLQKNKKNQSPTVDVF